MGARKTHEVLCEMSGFQHEGPPGSRAAERGRVAFSEASSVDSGRFPLWVVLLYSFIFNLCVTDKDHLLIN